MANREAIFCPGDEVELNIESVNHRGEGIGRHQGIVVFVPFTVPGERVLTRITELKKNHAIGKVVEVRAESERRVEPRCPVFESCGGSQFQHCDYELQLELKQRLVEDSLKRIGRIEDVLVHPVIGMENPWGYRNKAQFQVNVVDGKIRLGFFEEGTHTLVPGADCVLMDREMGTIAAMVEGILNEYKISAYDWQTGIGLVRHVIIRKSWSASQIMVVLVTSDEKFTEQYVIAEEMVKKVPHIVSVIRNINPNRTRQVFGDNSRLLAGQETITDQIMGLTFNISATAFFQVNSCQTEVLYEKVLQYAGLKGSDIVLDVYCGIGAISLLLASQANWVFGFEVSREAIRDAEENARMNKITNVEFISGKAEERLPKLVEQGASPDVVVVDPPRQGVEKRALQAIADMGPKRIVYVSCDPSTMARDVSFLSQRGYGVQEVQPVDMFPQTAHVETVVCLERKHSEKS